MDSDQACLQCHKEMAARLTSHTHHDADSLEAAVTTATCRTRPLDCSTPCGAIRCPRLTCAKASTTGGRTPAIFVTSIKPSVGRPTSCTPGISSRCPELSDDDKTISAAVQWLVKGDAGQRALLAWGMGWEPAQKISGRDWLYPYFDLQPARSLCRRPLRCLEIVADPAGIFGFQIHLHRGRRSTRRGGETKLATNGGMSCARRVRTSIQKPSSIPRVAFSRMSSAGSGASATKNQSCWRNEFDPQIAPICRDYRKTMVTRILSRICVICEIYG